MSKKTLKGVLGIGPASRKFDYAVIDTGSGRMFAVDSSYSIDQAERMFLNFRPNDDPSDVSEGWIRYDISSRRYIAASTGSKGAFQVYLFRMGGYR